MKILGKGLFLSVFAVDQLWFNWLPFKYGYMFFLGGLSFYFRKYCEREFTSARLKLFSELTVVSLLAIPLIVLFAGLKPGMEVFFVFSTFLAIVFIRDDSYLAGVLTNKPMIFLGSISYSFYLIHFIVLLAGFKGLPIGPINFIFSLAVTIGVSFLWYEVFEVQGYGRLKKKLLGFASASVVSHK